MNYDTLYSSLKEILKEIKIFKILKKVMKNYEKIE